MAVAQSTPDRTHSAYTFGKNKPVWVVSGSKAPLQVADDLKGLWSGAEDLPPYRALYQAEVCASVMHLLRRKGRPIGVIEFAAEIYVEPTPASLAEAETLAMIVSRALQMYEVRRVQRENTRRAIRILEEALKTERWTRLALPQLFVARSESGECDRESFGGELRERLRALFGLTSGATV